VFGGFQVGPFQTAYQQVAPVSQQQVEQPSGGWWAFNVQYEQELRRRRLLKEKQDELDEQSQEIQAAVDREIAILLRQQEAKDLKRAELERLRNLASAVSAREAEVQYGERVAKALDRAIKQGNFSALEALDRELQRARSDEEFFLMAVAMLLEDYHG
jgi:hypothetical protein